MTREVQIVAWCDACAVDGEQTPGNSHEVSGVMPMTIEIDLCERHERETGFASLAAALNKFGRASTGGTASTRTGRQTVAALTSRARYGRPPVNPRDAVCPWCSLTYVNDSALLNHARAVHGLAIPKGRNTSSVLLRNQCPLCGAPTGVIAAHCRNVHGASWGEVYRLALAAGDPFGVCAPIEAQARDVHRS